MFLQLFFYDTGHAVLSRGIGSDMATMDSAYFLSQVMLSAFMGYIVYYSGTVLVYLVCAGSMGAVACAYTTRIIYTKQNMTAYIRNSKLEPSDNL